MEHARRPAVIVDVCAHLLLGPGSSEGILWRSNVVIVRIGFFAYPSRAGTPRTSLIATRLKARFGYLWTRSNLASMPSQVCQPKKLCFGPAAYPRRYFVPTDP